MNRTKLKKAFLIAVGFVLLGFLALWVGVRNWRNSIISEEEYLTLGIQGQVAFVNSLQEENYFQRKRLLLRSYFIFEHLSTENPEQRNADLDRTHHQCTKRLFSRKEWLGF